MRRGSGRIGSGSHSQLTKKKAAPEWAALSVRAGDCANRRMPLHSTAMKSQPNPQKHRRFEQGFSIPGRSGNLGKSVMEGPIPGVRIPCSACTGVFRRAQRSDRAQRGRRPPYRYLRRGTFAKNCGQSVRPGSGDGFASLRNSHLPRDYRGWSCAHISFGWRD